MRCQDFKSSARIHLLIFGKVAPNTATIWIFSIWSICINLLEFDKLMIAGLEDM